MRLSTIVAVTSVLLMGALVHAQSLADVARKESDRRKADKAPGKVYTNKDLKPVAVAPPADTGSAPAATAAPAGDTKADAAASDKATTDAKSESKGADKDEAYWRKRGQDLRARLDEDRLFLDSLQSRVNALTADFVNRDDPAQRAKIGADRQKATTEMERLKKAVADDTKAITAFEEEARGAGVPPGWLR
jgi:hypothetical protein